jgi:F0F1-type ATP synthase membrane subunit b/b'
VKEKIEAAEKQAEELIISARNKALEIESNADGIAKKNVEKSKEKASMEADSILGNARANIEKEKLSMMNEMKSKVVNLSLRLNEKMFSKESANKDFMEKELEALK